MRCRCRFATLAFQAVKALLPHETPTAFATAGQWSRAIRLAGSAEDDVEQHGSTIRHMRRELVEDFIPSAAPSLLIPGIEWRDQIALDRDCCFTGMLLKCHRMGAIENDVSTGIAFLVEHDAFGFDDFAIDSPRGYFHTIGCKQFHDPFTTRSDVDFRMYRLEGVQREPLGEMPRIGPRLEHQRARRIDESGDGEVMCAA